ncbi:SNF2 helicase associated domain-containing protein [Clostridium sp. UBA1652]|uniref:SNF2 helicase associated domain-containing protein n=1 Tax=Clostridium sp. UBA1652 TaxID=1946348 RepID=UPI00257ED650|nr:SNF2 helicase associated domain-containing protein [Clostridium sp. UBA1652]
MRVTEKLIKEWTDDISFKRAKQYYEGDFIGPLEIKRFDIKGREKDRGLIITGSVNAFNKFSSNEVEIQWDSLSNQIEVDCDCNEDRDDGLLCKHIAAVLLKYTKEYQSSPNRVPEKSDIDYLIEVLNEASGVSEDYKRELNLEVKFFEAKNYERAYIELKLGLEKKYIVKSMRNFLNSLIKEESITFGKGFIYEPNLHKFNEVDEKIMEMFMEIRDLEGEGNNYYYNYNNPLFSGKKLLLTDRILYRFFRLAKERTMDLMVNETEYKDVKIIEGEMPLKFKMSIKSELIKLEQEGGLPLPLDKKYRVFYYQGNVYLPSKEQCSMYMHIHKLMESKKNKKLDFSKKDGEKIAAYLLPKLRAVADEVALDKNIKSNFYEEPLVSKVYLDKSEDFVTAEIKFNYGEIDINPLEENEHKKTEKILIRDIKKEETCQGVLKSFGFHEDKDRYVMKREEDIVGFISEGIKGLQDLSEVYYSESFKNTRVYGKSSLRGGVRLNEDNLLEFSFELEGIEKEELKNIFNALREKKKYYKLKEGGFVSLEDKGIEALGEMIDFLDIKDKDLSKEKILISKYNALYLDEKIKDKGMDYLKRSKNFRELANNIRDVKDMEYVIPPSLDSVMRNYQKIGFKWFKTLSEYGFGGILADEMGLGKTLQTLAFLLSEKGNKPSMVIAPTSLVYNWQGEIEKFAPSLKVLVVSGSKKQREELISDINNCDVVITSYPLIRRDIEEYKEISFNYCILDEAQQIKNPLSVNATAVKEIKAKGYFALTGTPIENSLTELWSIFDFVMPGYLLTHNKFTKKYETPIIKNNDKLALNELNKHINPFILRRLKKDVIKELPPKIEHKLVVEMTEDQKKLYAAYLSKAKDEIDEEIKENGFNKSKIKILSVLTRLRQICCDPSVFIEGYKGDNGKMEALDEILQDSIEQDHRILLFSQFTSVLKNIRGRLDKNGIKYMYLDGNTKSEDRMNLVKEFNEGDARVFLISLKAGGTGLNLTGADVVIHFDPWWNPAVEDQATDRAHRIGQQKTVEVIKLVAKGTIEEKIYNLQEKKKEMIKNVMKENMNEDNIITQMTQEDLESLFV